MWTLPLLILAASVVIGIPLGLYMARIFDGRYDLPGWLRAFEKCVDTGPQDWKRYTYALLLFNVGVELGQLLFIAACFAVWWPLRDLARERRWAPLVPAYAIGSLAAFWFISRATVLIA